MPLGTEVGLGSGDTVLDGDPGPLPPKGHSRHPQFSAHICHGQMAGWTNMPLGRKVGLNPSDVVLDGDPAPLPQKGAEPPIFGPCLLWPNGRPSQLLLSTCYNTTVQAVTTLGIILRLSGQCSYSRLACFFSFIDVDVTLLALVANKRGLVGS